MPRHQAQFLIKVRQLDPNVRSRVQEQEPPFSTGMPDVTAAGVKKLAAALPRCKIEWDGGVVEPKAAGVQGP